MNGRVYDPAIGRFLSVDPVFQFPENTQSLNPYTYVLNSPLSFTDPTGYETKEDVSEKDNNSGGGSVKSDGKGGLTATVGTCKEGCETMSMTVSVDFSDASGSMGVAGGQSVGSVSIEGMGSAGVSGGSGNDNGQQSTDSDRASSKTADSASILSPASRITEADATRTNTLDTPNEGAAPYDVSLSPRSFGSIEDAAIDFGAEFGAAAVEQMKELNTAFVESYPADGYGPPSVSYTKPLESEVGAKTVDITGYMKAVRMRYGASAIVGKGHNHWDDNPKFTGFGLDATVANELPLTLYNSLGETRVLSDRIMRDEVRRSGTKGADAKRQWSNVNNGFDGVCIHACVR